MERDLLDFTPPLDRGKINHEVLKKTTISTIKPKLKSMYWELKYLI